MLIAESNLFSNWYSLNSFGVGIGARAICVVGRQLAAAIPFLHCLSRLSTGPFEKFQEGIERTMGCRTPVFLLEYVVARLLASREEFYLFFFNVLGLVFFFYFSFCGGDLLSLLLHINSAAHLFQKQHHGLCFVLYYIAYPSSSD